MRLDGFGLFVDDMAKMIRFYRDVLGFEIKECEDTSNVYLIKDNTLFLLYGRKDFEKMTSRKYEYIKGLNGHTEIALYVDTYALSHICDLTTYFFPFFRTFSLNPRKSEYCLFRLTTFDLSGLISRPKRSFNHISVAL